MDRPISISAMAMYQRCGEQYRRRYIEGEILPPKVAMLRGRAVDEGANYELTVLRDTKFLPELDEVLELAADSARSSVQHGDVLWTAEEQERGVKRVAGELVDEVTRLARGHHTLRAPWTAPRLVQAEVEGKLAGLPFRGFLDLVERDGTIADLKTSAKRPSADAGEDSQQLAGYEAIYAACSKPDDLPRFSPKQRLDYLVPYKRKPRDLSFPVLPLDDGSFVAYFRIMRRAGPEQVDVFKARLKAMKQGVDAGTFMPANPDSWWCSDKWCGYHATCPYVRRPVTSAVPRESSDE